MDYVELIKRLLQVITDFEQEQKDPNDVTDREQSNGLNDANRFQQIADVNHSTETEYSNSPDERYSTVDKVTTLAGGGINYPKHPADIRANTVAMYPETRNTFQDYYNNVCATKSAPDHNNTVHQDMIQKFNGGTE